MQADIGLVLLIVALLLCPSQIVLAVIGYRLNQPLLIRYAIKPFALAVFGLTLIAFLLLINLFLNNDFSVSYVSSHSNLVLPWYYKISAVWGGHEGSMLLWVLIASGWALAVAIREKQAPIGFRVTIMSAMAMIVGGSLWFLVATSNPFARLLPFSPTDGQDLNPLLQDFGLIIHPPLLYMGYVGFSVAFAYAIGALVCKQMDKQWASWVRPWTNTAWAFLTVGIALGSWWAYYELGWGGWWFWDPVENASLMPWLAGTALIHSLSVLEKRNMFQRWVLLLSISTFSLSLLGTFLVRSGVLTSIHAFATDPGRGLFILIFLSTIIGSGLLLYGWRLKDIEFEQKAFNFFSRETALLVNNLIMVSLLFVVLLGTLYPLFYEVVGLGNLSVGAPYFNYFTIILVVPLVIGLTVGTHMAWSKATVSVLRHKLFYPLIATIIASIAMPMLYYQLNPYYEVSWKPFMGTFLGFAIMMPIIFDVVSKTLNKQIRAMKPQYWGMQLAHWGLATLIIGVSFTSSFELSRDVRLKAGESYSLGGYNFHVKRYKTIEGPNYVAEEARFKVTNDDGANYRFITAQKRRYLSGGNTMTEAGIKGNIWRDIYISMGEQQRIDDHVAWSMRLHVKPFIRWVWFGALFIALGALIALVNRRSNGTIAG